MKSKVLLIDDSVTIHRVIDLSIDFDRYEITKVFTKEDAGLKLQSEQFDYILLDIKLENMVVSDYVAELRQIQPTAKIILLVGNFDNFNESELEKTGADDYLVKPFGAQALNDKLTSEADMMNASIVERMAEADSVRDKDDFVSSSDIKSVSENRDSKENVEEITKQSYLENLEEVQPDDLTEHGYIEDDDNDLSEFENGFSDRVVSNIEAKEAEDLIDDEDDDIQPVNKVREESTDIEPDSTSLPVEVEENIHDEISEISSDNLEDDFSDDETVVSVESNGEVADDDSIVIDEDGAGDIISESEKENIKIDDVIEPETDKEEDKQEVSENKYVNDDNWLDDAPVLDSPEMAKSIETNMNDDEDMEALNNLIVDNTEMVVPPVKEVASVPDEVSDDYIMYDNLKEGHIGDEFVSQVPDFPEGDVDDSAENKEDSFNSVSEPVQEESLLSEDKSSDDIEEVSSKEDEKEEVPEIELPERDDNLDFSSLVVDTSEEEKKEDVSSESGLSVSNSVSPDNVYNNSSEVRNTNVGGITVTISRDEIMSMLGSAIDKHLLESAVKEVIAKNMQEIVRNIVPSIAEKYIKEEIERIKRDE